MMTDVFEELDAIYESDLTEDNNNFRSDKAKTALATKWLGTGATREEIKALKARSILHHLNGDHNNDENLENDVLIVADTKADAEMAHKLLHLLSYCYIQKELEAKLNELGVEFYYHPETSGNAQPIDVRTIASSLAAHDRRLRDIEVIDQDTQEITATVEEPVTTDASDESDEF